MKIWKIVPAAPLLAVFAAAVLSAVIVLAGTPYNPGINKEQALKFMGKVVSVDPSGASVSVRGDEGFKTFKTLPNMVKDLRAGDGVNISWTPADGGPKALNVSVTEKARHGSQSQQIREERIRARQQEAAEKAAKRARNLQKDESVDADLGYGRGYYVPPDQR